MPAPAAEPVAAYVQASSALTAAHRLSIPPFTAELEPTPLLDLALGTPARCEVWMPAPAAEPVAAFVQASSALIPARRLPVPLFAVEVEPAAQYVPWIAQAKPAPHAEAVLATVRPSAAVAQQVSVRQVAAIALRLPAIPQASRELFGAASAASVPAPEAVERLLVAADATVPVSIEHEPCRGVDLDAPLPVLESAPEFCRPVASPAPEPLESLLVPSVATPMNLAAGVRLQPFLLSVCRGRSLPSFAAQRLAPAASEPPAAVPKLEAPRPIATPVVTPPPAAGQPLELALPHPGLLPIEYHSYRLRSAAAPRAEWCTPRPKLLPPRFLLRPIVEKAEEPAPQPKPARKEPGFVDVLTMPGAKRQPSVWVVAGKVAAGVFLAAGLWFGVASFRVDRQLTATEDVSSGDAGLSVADNATSTSMPNGGTAGKPTPGGPVAWVRQTIANRASLKLAENFRGLENWEGAAKARPVGWSKHPDGYMKAGALALFRPSLKFKDYHMEFFGQIEAKSIGWTVRATDTMNYHAMKLSVVEAGMRPFVALVHYNVVDGKSGHRTQTPLNLMVHNNRPMQFAVDVRGNRVVTSIDGEEVDSFIDNTLVAGGVGFFSEEGERARLYWMSVSRNDDWLGRVCAMLAEEAGVESTAWLSGPELPGGAPAPRLPALGDGKTLAAVWFGMPYLGAARKTRFLKTWRSEPWNT
jgi:hypothetical protein